jgi:hypothetical protein
VASDIALELIGDFAVVCLLSPKRSMIQRPKSGISRVISYLPGHAFQVRMVASDSFPIRNAGKLHEKNDHAEISENFVWIYFHVRNAKKCAIAIAIIILILIIVILLLYYIIKYNILYYNAMQCNAMQCNAMQCNAMQCNAYENYSLC